MFLTCFNFLFSEQLFFPFHFRANWMAMFFVLVSFCCNPKMGVLDAVLALLLYAAGRPLAVALGPPLAAALARPLAGTSVACAMTVTVTVPPPPSHVPPPHTLCTCNQTLQ